MATKQVILTSGTSWTVPPDCLSAQVECIAGGQGGSSSRGGVGGGYAKLTVLPTKPGTQIPMQIGAGGVGSTTTTQNLGGITWMVSSNTVNASNGNSSAFGDVTYQGGSATLQFGGGAAGPHGAGGTASSTTGGNADNGSGGTGGTAGNPGNSGTEWGTVGCGGGGGAYVAPGSTLALSSAIDAALASGAFSATNAASANAIIGPVSASGTMQPPASGPTIVAMDSLNGWNDNGELVFPAVANSAGDCNVIPLVRASVTITGATDTAGNTYTIATNAAQGTVIVFCASTVAAASNVVTITTSSGSATTVAPASLIVLRGATFSASSANAVWVSGAYATPLSIGPFTTASKTVLVWASQNNDDSAGSYTFTGTPSTQKHVDVGVSGNIYGATGVWLAGAPLSAQNVSISDSSGSYKYSGVALPITYT